jgi:hypothetical protein
MKAFIQSIESISILYNNCLFTKPFLEIYVFRFFYFDDVKLMILKKSHLFHSLFSARAYTLAEGGGARTFRPLQSSSL